MHIPDILQSVESNITSQQEKEYFLIHVARYAYILEHIQRMTKTGSRFHGNDKGARILDVGCFPYHLGAALEMMGNDVYGISSSHEPVKSKKINICNIESDRFPFEDNFFDLVVCTEVLEHLPQSPLNALRQIHRVLAPQGRLVLTTPNIARSINRLKLLLGKNVSYPLFHLLENDGEGTNIYHRHNREYTLKELSTIVRHAHFFVEATRHFVSYTPMRRRTIPDSFWIKAGKYANYVLMLAIPSLRDTLLVIGRK